MYFKVVTGEPFTRNEVTGDDGVARGHCIKVSDAPDNIADWRMTYNFGTSSVDVKFEGQSNEDAVASYKAEKDKETADEATAGATKAAAERDAEDA